ncbi:unnamed protein product [Caenorhabditis brenneri]
MNHPIDQFWMQFLLDSHPIDIQSQTTKTLKLEELETDPAKIDDFALQVQPLSDQTFEGDNSVSLPTSTSTTAQSLVGDQERSYNYRSLLHNIHSYTVVLKNDCFKTLQSNIREELNEPEIFNKTLSERTIVHAIQKGIQDFPTKIKPEPLERFVTFRLPEYFQFRQYKLLDIGFSGDHELVLQVENLITDPDRQVALKLDKFRRSLETIFLALQE